MRVCVDKNGKIKKIRISVKNLSIPPSSVIPRDAYNPGINAQSKHLAWCSLVSSLERFSAPISCLVAPDKRSSRGWCYRHDRYRQTPDVYTVCSWCVTPSQLWQLQTTEGNPSRRQIDRTSLSSSRRRRKRDLEEIIDRSWTAVVVAFPSPSRGTIYIYVQYSWYRRI